MTAVTPRVLTTKEVAEILGTSPVHIWRMTKTGEIPCIRIGSAIRISKAWVARKAQCSEDEL